MPQDYLIGIITITIILLSLFVAIGKIDIQSAIKIGGIILIACSALIYLNFNNKISDNNEIDHKKINTIKGGQVNQLESIISENLGELKVFLIDSNTNLDHGFYLNLLENSNNVSGGMFNFDDDSDDDDIEILPDITSEEKIKKEIFSPKSYYFQKEKEYMLWFVNEQNEIVAFIVYEYVDRPDIGDHIFINQVTVHPKYRGNRLCPMSIKYLIELTKYHTYSLVNDAIPREVGYKCYVNTFINENYSFENPNEGTMYIFRKKI